MSRNGLILLLVFETVCAGFFLSDIFSALLGIPQLPWHIHELVEIGAAVGLLVGIAVTGRLFMLGQRRQKAAEDALRAASGAFHELLDERFDEWQLTPAERDVALFVIKGCPTAEIASLRGTSAGTVKAQTAAIYRKSGAANRTQLVSLFLEDLMDDGLLTGARGGG
ncbi:MAG: helix-turn-helix transcriptional regulator [Pseudomonadota bacterium]